MNIKNKHLLLSLVLGFIITLLFTIRIVAFTADFSYVHIFGFKAPELLEFDDTNYGKPAFGIHRGLPFSVYRECEMGWHGTLVSPACDSHMFGWSAPFLNFIFWSLIVYFILNLLSYRKIKPAIR